MSTISTEVGFAEEYRYTISPDPEYLIHSSQEMAERVKAPLEQRVRWVKDVNGGNRSVWSVDSTILVEGPSDAFREFIASFWKHSLNKKQVLTESSLYVRGVCTIFVSLISIFRWEDFPAMLGILTFGTIGVMAVLATQKGKDFAKIQQWNRHPAHEVAKLRTEAYDKPSSQAPAGILHPLEKAPSE